MKNLEDAIKAGRAWFVRPGEHEPKKIMLKNNIELHILHINLEAKTKQDFEDNCDLLKQQLENLI